MTDSNTPSKTRSRVRFLLIALAIVAIFIVDTVTHYELVLAAFYSVVILTTAYVLSPRSLIILTAICVVLTVLSFVLTQDGDWHAGLVNMLITIAVIMLVTYLTLKIKAAQQAANHAQTQLMRISRVKSVEGLTTSIAHEVSQPLAAIVTSGAACEQWLAQNPPNLEKARNTLSRIQQDADRATAIIERIRSLTQGIATKKQAFDFNRAVSEVLVLSLAEIERNQISIITQLSPELPDALADVVQIQQVIGNLLLNAVEAIASSRNATRQIQITTHADQQQIHFSIRDSGTGIPNDSYPYLFEAFWTTKEQGIGAGLSICRAIIEANGGQIWAEPASDQGTFFHFNVPIYSDKHSEKTI